MNRLAGRTAIVTGAGQGIGRGIALRFAKEGAQVAVCDINLQTAQTVVDEIKRLSGQAAAYKLDVRKSNEVESVVKAVIEKFGKIDILVNNAGIYRSKLVLDITEEEWDTMFAINVKGVFLCSKAVAKHMVPRKSGKIISIASDFGKTGYATFAHYCASKAAVILFTKSFALEMAPYKINVNSVCPGMIDTPGLRILVDQMSPELAKAAMDQIKGNVIPLGRLGTPDDVADIVTFLASDEANYMTGQAVNITGGLEMH